MAKIQLYIATNTVILYSYIYIYRYEVQGIRYTRIPFCFPQPCHTSLLCESTSLTVIVGVVNEHSAYSSFDRAFVNEHLEYSSFDRAFVNEYSAYSIFLVAQSPVWS